jgi:hypothetical protein
MGQAQKVFPPAWLQHHLVTATHSAHAVRLGTQQAAALPEHQPIVRCRTGDCSVTCGPWLVLLAELHWQAGPPCALLCLQLQRAVLCIGHVPTNAGVLQMPCAAS